MQKARFLLDARNESARLGCQSNTAAVADKLAFYGMVSETPRGVWAGRPRRNGQWEQMLTAKVKGVPAGRGLTFAADEPKTRPMMPAQVPATERANVLVGRGPAPRVRGKRARKIPTPAQRAARRIVNNV